jgi:hypothetical protein
MTRAIVSRTFESRQVPGRYADHVFPRRDESWRKTVSVDERSRLQLAEAAQRLLGTDEGITLMELLPPVGWADVATKHDLRQIDRRFDDLDARLDLRFTSLEDRIDAKLGSLEDRMDAKLGSLEDRMDAKLGSLEDRMDAKLGSLELRLEARFEKGFRQVVVTMMSLFITGFLAVALTLTLR